MRIALVHHQFGGGGGLEKYLSGFTQALASQGHELEVITSRVVNPPDLPNLQIHTLPRLKVLRALQLVRFQVDSEVMLEQLNPDLSIGFGQTVTQDIHRAGGGCHRVYSESLPWWKRYSAKNQIELDLERRLYTSGKTRHFVVNATKAAAELERTYGVPPTSISVIHTPVDLERFRPWEASVDPPREESRKKLDPQAATRPVFLFVSLNHRRKGLDALLDIWSEVDAQLWIVGEELAPRYQARVREEDLAQKVTYLGSRDDLPTLYRLADYFLHPTLYDACANTVLQSMASGLPGIISARDGAVDFVEDGQNGFRLEDPLDRDQLLHLIQQAILLSATEREALARQARARMSQQTWEAHLKGWLPLFERFSGR